MDLKLKDRLALVSGSTAGIGFAIATELSREGARVIVNGRTAQAVDAAVAQISAKTRNAALGFHGDLSEAAIAERVARTYPNVEILINNLGIFEPKPFEDIPDTDWVRFFLSPWNRGTKRPSEQDVARIIQRAPRAYSSSRLDKKPQRRAAVVERTLKDAGQKVRARPTEVGQVRVRFRPNENTPNWRLEMLNGALQLQSLSSFP